jgi:hypothetical protein
MNTRLKELFQQLIARPYVDQYNVGVQFFFNLRHLERLAGEHCIPDNRSAERGIRQLGGFNTVPDLDFLELETYLWEQIKPLVERNNITFISTCMALTYQPHYAKVKTHLHREGLREINPSPYNYTFFFCDDPTATVDFNVVDHPVPFEDIVNYELVNYVSHSALKDYIVDKPVIPYNMQHGDVMRFDATKVIHGAEANFTHDAIGAYLVLNGCADTLPQSYHRQFKNEF